MTIILSTVAAATLSFTGAAAAAPPDEPVAVEQRIEFAPGTDNAAVEGAVVRGTINRYLLRAAAGQVLTVAVDSVEANAVVTVTSPSGAPLLAEGAVTFSGTLPESGDYVIDVHATRGNATYRMAVWVTDAAAPAPPAETAARIEFAPGADRSTVQGVVPHGSSQRYILWAAAGQTMSIDLDSVEENADVRVSDPTGAPLVEGVGGYVLPRNGDYVIEVFTEGGDSTFTMIVVIPGEAATDGAQRVEFAPGTNHASLTGDVLPATLDRYILRAAAGQTMVVHIDSVTDNVTFSIHSPDGTPLAQNQVRATVVLPADGDYTVDVATTSSGGPYRVSFWIE